MKKSLQSPLIVSITALLLGLLGGGLAYILLRTYIPEATIFIADAPGQDRDQQIEPLLPSEKIIKKLPQQLVRIYSGAGETVDSSSVYTKDKLLGYGLYVTSNGWLVTSISLPQTTELSGLTIFDSQRRSFKVSQLVYDNIAGVSYLKIEVSEAVVVDLVTSADQLTTTKPYFITNGLDLLQPIYIDSLTYRQASLLAKPESTDYFNRFYHLNLAVNEQALSLPVIDDNGTVIGLLTNNQEVLPSVYFTSHLEDVFKNKKISRPKISVEYLNLSDNPTTQRFDDRPLMHGALITKDNSSINLKIGDVVLEANGLALNGKRDLTYFIQKSKPGEKLKLKIIRDDKEQELEITL